MKFIAGIIIGAIATVAIPAGAAPSKAPIETECRGNGDGGFRRCDVSLSGPRKDLKRVDVWIYINGREEIGFTYRPTTGSLRTTASENR